MAGETLAQRLGRLRQRISQLSGQDTNLDSVWEPIGEPGSQIYIPTVRLLAVSKRQRVETILEAISCGHTYFAESYVQEALAKFEELKRFGVCVEKGSVEFDYIGRIQRNKVKLIVGRFSLIHSVDRVELAEAIANEASRLGLGQRILLQVNISGEDSKGGFSPDKVEEALKRIVRLSGLSVEGLMSFGRYVGEEEPYSVRSAEFVGMRELRDSLVARLGIELPSLSMGVSHDYDIAIREGATIVRIGAGIFEERDESNQEAAD